jgi:hypothetical protein
VLISKADSEDRNCSYCLLFCWNGVEVHSIYRAVCKV